MVSGAVSQLVLLRELEPVIGANLHRHLAAATTWDPAEYVDPERYWRQRRSTLTETAKAALVTTLLTHSSTALDHREVYGVSAARNTWSKWMYEWNGEKKRHAEAIHRYLVATQSVDPVALDRARFQCMTVGIESAMEGQHLLRSIVHATVDVMATMVSHRNTAAECNDQVATKLLGRIVADQQLHLDFLRDAASAALDIAPAQMAKAITEVILNFRMPGTGMPGFERSAMLVSRNGIYDLRRHLDEVLLPILRHWRIFDRVDLGRGAGSTAILSDFLDDLENQAEVIEAQKLRAS
ncbi:acyl-ACP desaturase [Rhodococcus sp. BP22]|uniref:acyl-ACP desaturase n=1 Tax=Rhodococcus sp. BP22 TaxID=2758566 RepID=UPI001645A989|nr:acyl-ACP desaturase [Rhodococcus sp. BP22]